VEKVRARVRFLDSRDVAPWDAVGEVTSPWLIVPVEIVLRAEAYSARVSGCAMTCHMLN
jgi:hypothetical protein